MAIEKVIDIKVQGNADQAVGSLRSQLRQAQADVAELSNKFGAFEPAHVSSNFTSQIEGPYVNLSEYRKPNASAIFFILGTLSSQPIP